MKTFLYSVVAITILLFQGACVKRPSSSNCTPNTVASEEPAIHSFAIANGINATRDTSGLYYQIISQGSGTTPGDNSKVFVTYTGKFITNGAVFGQVTDPNQTGWSVGQLIVGLEVGLKLIQKGGEIKLIVPSSLAYGCKAVGNIPENSVLYFDVVLVDVQ